MSNQFTLGVALDQPDDTKMTLTNVIIVKSELKMTKTNKSYHSCTVEGDGQKTYVSIYGNAPQFLNRRHLHLIKPSSTEQPLAW